MYRPGRVLPCCAHLQQSEVHGTQTEHIDVEPIAEVYEHEGPLLLAAVDVQARGGHLQQVMGGMVLAETLAGWPSRATPP